MSGFDYPGVSADTGAGGGGDGGGAGGGGGEGWTCSLCTFENGNPEALQCTMCMSPRAAAFYSGQVSSDGGGDGGGGGGGGSRGGSSGGQSSNPFEGQCHSHGCQLPSAQGEDHCCVDCKMGDGCTCGVMMVIKLAEMESDRDQVLAELTNLAEIHNQSIAELASVTNDKEYTENLLDGERKKAEKLAAKLASEKKKGALRDPTPDPRAARVSEQEFRLEAFDLEEKIDALTKTVKQEQKLRASAEAKAADEERQRIAVEANLEAVESETLQRRNSMATKQETMHAQLSGQVETLESAAKENEATIKTMKKEVDDLSSENSSLEKALAKIKKGELKQLGEEVSTLRASVEKLERTSAEAEEERDVAVSELAEAKAGSQQRIVDLEKRVKELDLVRRQMHEQISELRGNVRVFARVRPYLPNDKADPGAKPWLVVGDDKSSLGVLQAAADGGTSTSHLFNYDHAFPPSTSQEDVFDQVGDLVQSALDGYNVCLFSYGQTGSGKTHSMQGSGTGDMRGIIPRAIEKIANSKEAMEDDGWKYTMHVSFVEIYCEKIKDLLRDVDGEGGAEEKQHKVQTNAYGQNVVSNAKMIVVEPGDSDRIDEIMEVAGAARAVAKTDMNAVSSRSHSVFTLHLTGTNTKMGSVLHGQLNLVDLAGSERIDRSNVQGQGLVEAKNINKSLSSLADVFDALAKKQTFVPFRNSTLTFLLEMALSGNGKTLMMLNLSPTEASVQESLSSLRFGSKVNSCELGKAQRSIGGMDGVEGGEKKPRKGNTTPAKGRTPKR